MPATANSRKRRATVPSIQEWESDANKFTDIRKQLLEEKIVAESTTAKQLANLMGQLSHFHEEAFGIDAPEESKRKMTKLPASVFRDYARDGAMFIVLRTAHAVKEAEEMRRFDFTTPNKREKNVTMFQQMRSALAEKGFIQEKKVYLDETSLGSDERKDLETMISRLSGVACVASKESATHVIEADPEHLKSDENDEADFLRTIDVEGDSALVHWWYYPDSYDQWIPQKDVEGESETPQQRACWRLHARFIRDSFKFNEWVNETDYDLDEDEEDEKQDQIQSTPSKTTTRGGRRKKGSKRAKKQTPIVAQEDKVSGNKRSADESSNGYQQQQAAAKKQKISAEEQMDVDTDSAQTQPTPSTPQSQTLQQQQQPATQQIRPQLPPAIIPSHASWFKLEEIHEIEKKAFPEFFPHNSDSSTSVTAIKSPETYKQYRNFMINTFRSNPSTYLTATACRKVLAGDVVSIMKIHGFLEHWGLINFTIDPRNKPTSLLQSVPSSSQGQQGTMLYDYTREPQTASERMIMLNSNLKPRRPQQTPQPPSSDWSEEETLRLLDALSTLGDNWDAIAQKVKSKTKEQCMLHFLQLPIEDQFLQTANATTESENYEQPLPFADASNPIMATVAFLASVVSPSVAAAAASAAMKEFEKEQNAATGGDGSSSAAAAASSSSSSQPNGDGQVPFDIEKLDTKTAAAAALGAAVGRARQLVIKEEHEIQRLLAALIEKQLQKLELKMKHFEKLEGIIAREREQLEEQKQKLFKEKLEYMRQRADQEQQQQQSQPPSKQ